MTGARVVAFTPEFLPAAGALLAARHARHREIEPLLSGEFDYEAMIATAMDGGSGFAAFRGNDLVGYLVGKPEDSRFGRMLTSGYAGHTVRDPELIPDLYAAASEVWVREGLVRHNIFVPLIPGAVDPWFYLSFGGSALQAVRALDPDAQPDLGGVVRRGTTQDVEAAARLEVIQESHMTRAPSFNGDVVADEAEKIAEWSELDGDERFVHFVAERDGRVQAHALLYHRPSELRVPLNNIDLAACATEPGSRNSGLATALTDFVVGWAAQNGFHTMTTDWRLTNIVAARFWPRRGFRPAFIRLYRSIP